MRNSHRLQLLPSVMARLQPPRLSMTNTYYLEYAMNHTNTIIKSFILILALSSLSLTAQARDSLESLRADLNAAISNIPVPHVIGETYGGGKVFYVDDSGQHGLIAALADRSTGIQWYNGTNKFTGTTGDGLYAGAMNTAIIIAAQMNDNPAGNFAAKVAADYSVQEDGVTPCTGSAAEICYGDWYLPSMVELNLLYQQKALWVVLLVATTGALRRP